MKKHKPHFDVLRILTHNGWQWLCYGKDMPTVERKTGKWIDGESIFFGGKRHYMPMTCSCCGRTALNEPWKFCPNCGAKMGDET